MIGRGRGGVSVCACMWVCEGCCWGERRRWSRDRVEVRRGKGMRSGVDVGGWEAKSGVEESSVGGEGGGTSFTVAACPLSGV